MVTFAATLVVLVLFCLVPGGVIGAAVGFFTFGVPGACAGFLVGLVVQGLKTP